LAEARKGPGASKPQPTLLLEISGNTGWTDCTIESIVGYPKRPNDLQLELLEMQKDSSIGRSISSGKVLLSYNKDGVAHAGHIDLSSCEHATDKASGFVIRMSLDGEIYSSQPASVKVAAAAAQSAPAATNSSSGRLHKRTGICWPARYKNSAGGSTEPGSDPGRAAAASEFRYRRGTCSNWHLNQGWERRGIPLHARAGGRY